MEKTVNGIKLIQKESEQAVYADMAQVMLDEIKKNNAAGKKTVMIVPVGPTDQYPILAEMVNREKVSLKNVYFFNMDEYLITPTQVIAHDDPLSFYKRMQEEFYTRVDPALVMPLENRAFPEPGKEKAYDERIAALGGVDLCLGGMGINGHIAFNEPPEEEVPAEEFASYGTRVLAITRETRTINATGYLRGDIAGMPKWCITVGMSSILSAKRIYLALNRGWQHGILKRVLFDPISSNRPCSLLRNHKDVTFCMTPEVGNGIF